MGNSAIIERLFSMQDEKYRDFQSKLIPDTSIKKVIGVRTPQLKAYAKELVKSGETEQFLAELPHEYFDEYQLHAFIISETKDYNKAIEQTERFLPYIDNWATCDQLRPKAFKKHKDELLAKIRQWIKSDKTYTIRFSIGMLMCHFLDDDFKPEYPELAAGVVSDEYYVNMMIAWYFATALAKQYESAVKYIEKRRLSPWVHNKTIQKARESFRVTDEHKEYLNKLKIAKIS
ncbi:MAG: DNA alkylation repair protein [Ruminococcus sp.]|nr:DNA alkylation repair protein [Ruminococcus sp.]